MMGKCCSECTITYVMCPPFPFFHCKVQTHYLSCGMSLFFARPAAAAL